MEKDKRPYVCPAEYAGSLDNSIRRLVHKPHRILEGHVSRGMTVLDLGCGPGYFTIELARLVGKEGKVIAADLQQGMLDKVAGKIRATDLETRIVLHKCQDRRIGISQKVDFVLAFWMVQVRISRGCLRSQVSHESGWRDLDHQQKIMLLNLSK
jgi:23S rRNA U2552 (ribose-2'-O)-methylase RlmE/FtsJ